MLVLILRALGHTGGYGEIKKVRRVRRRFEIIIVFSKARQKLTEGDSEDETSNEEDCGKAGDLVSPPAKGLLEAVLHFLLTAHWHFVSRFEFNYKE